MRYPDNVGYVWLTIARNRDLVARNLGSRANCLIAFPQLTDSPAYQPTWLSPVALDLYDYSEVNKVRISSIAKEKNIKLVVFMSAEPSTINLSFLNSLGIQTINTENDSYDHSKTNSLVKLIAKDLTRKLLRHNLHDVYIANASSQRRFLAEFARIPENRLFEISDAVDVSHFRPGQDIAPADLDRSRVWLMSASQARPEKRVSFIIEAARRILDINPMKNIGFFHVGDGECLESWRREAFASGLGGNFIFVGQKDDLLPYYRASRIFLHAAKRESFGLVLVEAMSCGVPVVATRSAGPEQTIANGETGQLVASDDIDGFVSAIQLYLDDESLRIAHGNNARDRAVSLFSIERQASAFSTLLFERFPGVFRGEKEKKRTLTDSS